MDECKELQLEELEALESMYASELTILCKTYPEIKIKVEINVDSEQFVDLFGCENVNFCAKLPPLYPNEEIPLIDFTDLKANDENELNEDAKIKLLITKVASDLEKIAKENLGMPMLFTLINEFKESLITVCTTHSEELANIAREEQEKAENEALAKFDGTRVTVETFNKWKEVFLEEIRLKKGHEAKEIQSGNRLTGKQQFLADKSLGISDLQFLNMPDQEEVKEEEDYVGEGVAIDQSLFEDDLDISDEETSDEDYGTDEEDEEEEEEDES
ncbi:RWD domain-containing protein [Meloidogyne graminicola]|uniref:RWD domain-containing protein n=1 Tax=Meloidogyne graminicola TaxID=189291 RepID=A0A8S9ZMK8_9BILA|nr:RWD domain-containing protein [Meloidogyne graminicola]